MSDGGLHGGDRVGEGGDADLRADLRATAIMMIRQENDRPYQMKSHPAKKKSETNASQTPDWLKTSESLFFFLNVHHVSGNRLRDRFSPTGASRDDSAPLSGQRCANGGPGNP